MNILYLIGIVKNYSFLLTSLIDLIET